MDYQSVSSKTAPSEDKNIQKVVTGSVKTKKKNKIANSFFSEDVRSVKEYLIFDFLIPSLKKGFVEMVSEGVRMLFLGEAGARSGPRDYSSIYDSRDRFGRSSVRRPVSSYGFDDVILDTRGEAEDVIARMDDLIATYKMVTVADMYELVGLEVRHTDYKYGWTNLRSARAVRVPDGWLLDLPKALPIER